MKRLLLLLLLLGSLPLARRGQGQGTGMDFERLDAFLLDCMERWKVPGMAVAVCDRDGLLFSKGYGLRDVRGQAPIDGQTLFGIASNSKAFTAMALAMLVDEGKLSWDDKVIDLLPEFRSYDPYVTQNATVRDLLSHRIGLATFSGDLIWYASDHTPQEILELSQHLPPAFGFRAGYGYSNIMYLAAGMIVERVSGQPWGEFVRGRILTPLGMDGTCVSISELPRFGKVATPHAWNQGKPLPIEWVNWDNMAPAGAINSTAEDMTRWLRLQLNRGQWQGQRLVSEDRLWEMWSPQNHKALSMGQFRSNPSRNFELYGLGWALMDYNGAKVVHHSGGLDGMISHTAFLPEENLGFVILTNGSSWLPGVLLYDLLDLHFQQFAPERNRYYSSAFWADMDQDRLAWERRALERQPEAAPSLPLEGFAGRYQAPIYGQAEVRVEGGRLVLDFLHTPILRAELEHWQFNSFRVRMPKMPSLPNGMANFTIGPDGQVLALDIDVPNPDFDFTELKFVRME